MNDIDPREQELRLQICQRLLDNLDFSFNFNRFRNISKSCNLVLKLLAEHEEVCADIRRIEHADQMLDKLQECMGRLIEARKLFDPAFITVLENLDLDAATDATALQQKGERRSKLRRTIMAWIYGHNPVLYKLSEV